MTRAALALTLLVLSACMERQGDDAPKPSPSAREQKVGDASAEPRLADATVGNDAQRVLPSSTNPHAHPPVPPNPRGADLDPSNDLVVAPPDAIADCHEELTRAGVTFRAAELPLRKNQTGTFTCGAHDAVVMQKWASGTSVSPPALVTCRMALALVHLEPLIQEVATRELGTAVRKIHQLGTYSCRKMVRFDFVSEHSYGNAIDIGSFTLADGRNVSVLKHFGKLDAEPPDARGRFLRALGNAAFDRDIVSVSLGPYWDTLHKDHFHFDMAHYRVDGSRPQ